MNVSGVDPSIAGCGLARVVDGVVVTATIATKPQGDALRDRLDRARFVAGRALDWLPTSGLFVIEAPSFGSSSQGLRWERMFLYGLLCDHLTRRGHVVEVAPTTRAMYATGSGRSKKPEVLAAMRLSFPGVRVSNDNAADALALAAMGSRNLGLPLEAVDLTKKQMAAGQTLPWLDRKDQ